MSQLLRRAARLGLRVPPSTATSARPIHTYLHRPISTSTASRFARTSNLHNGYGYTPRIVARLPSAAASAASARTISYSYIPRLVLRASTRLPVVLVGGTAAGGAYVVAKVEAARNSVYGTLEDFSRTAGDVWSGLGRGVGDAGEKLGEGLGEARNFGTGIFRGIRGFVSSLLPEQDASNGEETNGGKGDDQEPRRPPPERIAAAAALAGSSLPRVLNADSDDNDDFLAPSDDSSNDLMLLTKKLIEIRSILLSIDHTEGLQLPAIVVIGSQSSGKSSVLEAVVGREFLPKGTNMVTRRPIELTLIHTPATPSNPNPKTFAEFPAFAPGQHLTDFSVVQKTLYDLNMSIPSTQAVSSVPVELRIHSPNVPDLSLVDLPGYIELSSMDQPDSLKEEIANLVEKYIKPPNIILAVCSADVDLANSPALRASRRVDPLGMRTIGVITKMDLVEPAQGADILTNKRYPLSLGYVGVVCKAAAKSREGKDIVRVKSAQDDGLQGPVRQQERAFFGGNREHFNREGVQVTTDLLKRRLMDVLEESMANSLHSISNNVALELEEAKYQFKVQYNDRRVSPQSYMTETLDTLKRRLDDFSKSYGKDHVRRMLKAYLDDDTMEILAKIYWQDTSDTGRMDELVNLQSKIEDYKKRKAKLVATGGADGKQMASSAASASGLSDPETAWKHKLEAATSSLTKSGVGRKSTQLVVDAIRSHTLRSLMSEEPLIHHPSTSDRITSFSDAILRDRYALTADQVENCIKPFKYEIELDAEGKEWEKGRAQSVDLLNREVEMCEGALGQIRESVGGGRRLNKAMQYVSDLEARERRRSDVRRAAARKDPATGMQAPLTPEQEELLQEDAADPSRPVFNPSLLVKAREANFLQGRTALLKARVAALKSRQCRAPSANASEATREEVRRYCPEAFLNVVSDKLASTAVMFINIELLQEYFYLFPREIESKLGYDLSATEILDFARENPRFKAHLDLQERKDKLDLVTEKLDALLKLQQERQGPIRHATNQRGSGSSGSTSGKRFSLF